MVANCRVTTALSTIQNVCFEILFMSGGKKKKPKTNRAYLPNDAFRKQRKIALFFGITMFDAKPKGMMQK